MDGEPNFDDAKDHGRAAVESFLVDAFAKYPPTEVRRAAEYATLGGHRWRALVAVAAGKIFDRDALNIVLPCAGAIELVQAATLILDDLPSMDDARLRRGKPCTHLVFPNWAVDMAPAFLLSMAYEISLNNPRATPERRTWAAVEFSRAGLTMIAGQVRDVTRSGEEDPSFDLIELARLKAGAFFGASTMVGSILCGAKEHEAKALYAAGVNVGLSYQILDDVADVTARAAELGKEPGSDAAKFTVVDWLGVDGARRKAERFQSLALAEITQFGREADWLRSLIRELSWKAR
ncbi:MAG: hypothetical protein GY798_11495 [Hyphomicrobiales bacterium]|nr:hypothetical protein [Hyphomicrobiales bacterium]